MGQAAQFFSRLRRKGGHLRRTLKKLEKSCTYISLMAVTVAGAYTSIWISIQYGNT
jgi:hypothetical protein